MGTRKYHAQVDDAVIKGDLAPDASLEVILLKLIALLLAAIAADGRHVEHAIAELNEGAALYGDVQVSDVVQHKIDELLEGGLPQVFFQALRGHHLAVLVRHQAVL